MVTSEMRDGCERINEQWPPLADAFREIHRFILKAVEGNAAAANALFQRYLNGELPDEFAPNCAKLGAGGASERSQHVARGEAGEYLTPVRPMARRRLRRAGERRCGARRISPLWPLTSVALG